MQQWRTYMTLGALLALGTTACGGGPGLVDSGLWQDGATADAPGAGDGSSEDGAIAFVDGAMDDGATLDLDAAADDGGDLDAGCDPCPYVSECLVLVGCECAPLAVNEGLPCNGELGTCSDGVCIGGNPGCGNGTRERALGEGCDDFNTHGGDACSPVCEPTLLVVASVAGQSSLPPSESPAMAIDGAGSMLFVWVATVSPAGTDPYRRVYARLYSDAGEPLDAPLLLEDFVGSTQPVRPRVAGQGSGWVVTWRSTAIEGRDGEQGGIAFAQVSHDGRLRRVREANTVERGDQLDPSVVTLSSGFVIVWTDTSAELVSGDLRMREFDALGTPIGGELAATTTTAEDQSHAVAAAVGDATSLGTTWALAFTDTSDPSLEPRVRMRRFDRMAPSDASDFLVSHAWSAEPTLAMTSTDAIVGWTGRVSDVHGDVFVRRISHTVTPADDATVDPPYTTDPASARVPAPADTLASVAPFPADGSGGYVVAWHTDGSALGGARVRLGVSSGVTLAPEAIDLDAFLVPGSSSISLASTARGLWVGWADASTTGVPDAFVAYLLPWD